jgi:hypothetical protein
MAKQRCVYFHHTSTTGITTVPREVYAISWIWLALVVFSILVLIACAIVAVVYNLSSVNPEILGSCSSLLRNSKYVDPPPGGWTLNGLEMTGF